MQPIKLLSQYLTVLVGIGLFLVQPLPATADDSGFHLISEVKGEVKIKRAGRKVDQVAHVGDRLRTADILRVGKGGAAKVLCQNTLIWNLKTTGNFPVSQGCQATGRAILQPTNDDRIPTRSPNDPTIPYIISPRDTAVLEAQPLLRWNPVVGVKRYQVEVQGPGVRWQIKVEQSQVVYGDSQPLKPGMRYRVVVTADNGASSQSDTVTGFTLLDKAAAGQIKTEVTQLQQQALSEEGKILAVAHLERSNELNAAAIDRLEQWLSKGNRSAAANQLLGNLYWQVGLPRLARERYVTGLELMKQDGNLEGQAEILTGLGKVDESLAQLKQAIEWLGAAQESYQALGDEAKVREIQDKLADLKQRV
jgi:predicted Rdx family selenoprotein